MRALSSAALGAPSTSAPGDDPPPAGAPPGGASRDALPAADSSGEPKPLASAVQHHQRAGDTDHDSQHDHVRRLHAQLDAHFHLEQQPSPELDDLDEPLFFAARRRGRSADPVSPAADDLPRDGATGAATATRRAQQRPASSYIPASAWSSHLSQLALAPRKSTTRASSASPSAASRSRSGASDERDPAGGRAHAATESAAPAAPTRARSSSADGPFAAVAAKGSSSRLNRASPAPLFRHSLRLPFLPPIPASPLPSTAVSPGLTRSASSPPILPDIALGGPLSPSFALVPPTAPLSPPAAWPNGDDAAARDHDAGTTARVPPPLVYRSSTSASAPDLSLFSYAPVSEASSYFSSPAPTAASSPTAATVPLPLAGAALALGPTSSSSTRAAFEYDSDLVADDVTAAAAALADADAKERADAAQLDERRYHALVELVDTERGYLEHLRVLVQVYFRTLPFLTALTAAEVQAVVRNANELLELHERIADRVDQVERELSWRDDGVEGDQVGRDGKRDKSFKTRKAAGRIASIFADEASSFVLYHEFCARHAEALDITRSVASRPEWEAFERQCAARVALDGGRGDRTPIASANSSGFFPPVSAATSASPLPFSATPLATPSHSSGSVPTMASLVPSAASSISRTSRLRFVDYAIAPVQRVTRYPLVFGQLAKFFVGSPEHADLTSTWTAFKRVAQGVDAAKREREGEMRTKVVARRMEFNTPLVGGTFCDILGPTLLVGALHVVHSGGPLAPPAPMAATAGVQHPGEVLKVKYLGCFLYRSHLVMAKVKKRASYEPKEWLPLRLFDIQGVDDGQGLLSHSIRLSYRDHQFELGALCDGERSVWLSQLLAAQADARRIWDTQDRDEHGKPTLFDDSVVSSVATDAAVAQRRSHSRSASSISVVSTFGGSSSSHAPSSSSSPVLVQEEPVPPVPIEYAELVKTPSPSPPAAVLSTSAPLAPVLSPPSSTLTLATTPTLASRSRFSSTASSLLLGRTPASQRAAVDLRLADVFSEECLSARAQAAREVELERAASLASRRFRTISGPKRSMTTLAPASSHSSSASPPFSSHKTLHGPAGSVRERRRMSSAEVGLALAERAEFRGAIGFDAAQAALYHHNKAPGLGLAGLTVATTAPDKERGRSWANAIRKAGHKTAPHGGGAGTSSSASASRPRPALSDIDTAVAERSGKRGQAPPLSAGASWSRRGGRERERDRDGGLGGQLRRVASVDATPTSLPTSREIPDDAVAASTAAPGKVTASSPAATSGSTADVERNNSVSSTTSSSGTGTNSSSSHAHGMQVIDTPPSSIPPSPDFGTVELADALCPPPPPSLGSGNKAAFPVAPPPTQHASPRWSTVSDGMSNVFRIRRRKSTLGLVPPAFPTRTSPSASDESLTLRSPTIHASDTASSSPSLVPASAAVKLQRRASTTISGLFSSKKRMHSSPSLAGSGGYFGGSGPSSSSPHLPLSRTSTNSGSSSQATSPQNSPDQLPTTPEASSSRELAPASSSSSAASTSSSASKPAPAASAMKRARSSGGSKGPMLLRSRTRFLFASHHGMTPMS
ncbi:hypothetical protein JCM3775_006805 [Rhodotorula graminis]